MPVTNSATPARTVLPVAAGAGALVLSVIAFGELWFTVGRPIEDLTGSLLLGIAGTGVFVDGIVLALAGLLIAFYVALRRR